MLLLLFIYSVLVASEHEKLYDKLLQWDFLNLKLVHFSNDFVINITLTIKPDCSRIQSFTKLVDFSETH